MLYNYKVCLAHIRNVWQHCLVIIQGSECENLRHSTWCEKKGFVISSLLFNAGLKHAMRKWTLGLQHYGFDLGNGESLTNVRYAHDLMLYAKHCDELISMMEILIEELSAVGLHLNTSTTKILAALTDLKFLDVGGDMIEVVHGQDT